MDSGGTPSLKIFNNHSYKPQGNILVERDAITGGRESDHRDVTFVIVMEQLSVAVLCFIGCRCHEKRLTLMS